MIDSVGIGRNIRAARTEKKMTQRELAEKSEVSQTQLCDYENGNKTPGLFSLARIAKVLDKSIDELFYGDAAISFITSAPDRGSIIANALVALWEQGVIETSEPLDNNNAEYNEIRIRNYAYPLKRLVKNLNELERNLNTYSEPDKYLEMVKKSVAKDINIYG